MFPISSLRFAGGKQRKSYYKPGKTRDATTPSDVSTYCLPAMPILGRHPSREGASGPGPWYPNRRSWEPRWRVT
jgi:hypothetical protein